MYSEKYDTYLMLCTKQHATRKTFTGLGVLKHRSALFAFSEKIGAASALDFGCGKGMQYEVCLDVDSDGRTLEEALGYEVAKYDPAVPKFETRPTGEFDLVWCTDVLELIPEQDMPEMIRELEGFARKGLFVTVGIYPSKKTLPNGENAHITVKPPEWWRAIFADNLTGKVEFQLLAG